MLVVKIERHPGGFLTGEPPELIEKIAIANVGRLSSERSLYHVWRHTEATGIEREPDGQLTHRRADGAAVLVERALELTNRA